MSQVIKFIDDVMNRNNGITTYISTYIFVLRRPAIAIFANIMNILTIFIKIILEDSSKVKINKNYVSKWNLYLYFLI